LSLHLVQCTNMSDKPVQPRLGREQIYERLKEVIDPELSIDVVSLGLVYEVVIKEIQTETGPKPFVHILFTLTTPGCPLAGVFDTMIKEALKGLPDLDINKNVMVELTFDPPWVPEMINEEARAELGFD
jgi:metal-sulfur cluster biosynthetic enzyme